MKIRVKHGPHIVAIDAYDSLEMVFLIAKSALNDAYGLNLTGFEGITLELIGGDL